MIRAFAVVLFVVALGCGQESATPATAVPAPVMTAAPATAAPVVAEATPQTTEELPVPEDFEPEATTGVTEANYRAELDRIAGEIAAQ